MKWGEFFKAGGAAGYTPQEVKGMSLWEFLMTIEGWKLANGSGDGAEGGEAKPPSEDEFDAMMARYDAGELGHG